MPTDPSSSSSKREGQTVRQPSPDYCDRCDDSGIVSEPHQPLTACPDCCEDRNEPSETVTVTLERELLNLARAERAKADAGGIPNHIEAHRAAQGAYETAADLLRAALDRTEQEERRTEYRVVDCDGECPSRPLFTPQEAHQCLARCDMHWPAESPHRIQSRAVVTTEWTDLPQETDQDRGVEG